MDKSDKVKTFKKNEVLKAEDINKKIEDVGSVDGLVPYSATTKAKDPTMSLPIGSLTNPFGNVFAKGLNVYTEAQVLAYASAGKLTGSDIMFFLDPGDLTFKVWNGTEIVPYLGGGVNSMDYLFGDGSDGDVTVVTNTSYDTPKNFRNLTINAGVTVGVSARLIPLIIRCTGTLTINGTISVNEKGFSAGSGYFASSSVFSLENNFGLVSVRGGLNVATGSGGIAEKVGNVYARLASLNTHVGLFGGAGSSSGAGYGGGCVLIYAKKIVLSATGVISANGGTGSSGTSGDYIGSIGISGGGGSPSGSVGGGGGGGLIAIYSKDFTRTGNLSANGGDGYNHASSGGTITVPNSQGANGVDGSGMPSAKGGGGSAGQIIYVPIV